MVCRFAFRRTTVRHPTILFTIALVLLASGFDTFAEEQPKITTPKLAENLYLLMPQPDSSSGNVVALVGGEGVLLVDSGLPETAALFQEAIESLHSPNPAIKYLIIGIGIMPAATEHWAKTRQS